MNNNEKYMKIALIEANKAYKKGEIPVGAIIVDEKGRIISKGYNNKEIKKDITCHAEIIAIRKAAKKLNTWHLDNCTLYVTLEPCLMCYGAITESRIKKVVCAVKSPKYGYSKFIDYENDIDFTIGILEKESSKLLKEFFKDKR